MKWTDIPPATVLAALTLCCETCDVLSENEFVIRGTPKELILRFVGTHECATNTTSANIVAGADGRPIWVISGVHPCDVLLGMAQDFELPCANHACSPGQINECKTALIAYVAEAMTGTTAGTN